MSGSPDTASKSRSNTPSRAQRRNRRKALFQLPNPDGRSRHGKPARTRHNTTFRNSRVPAAVTPRSVALPGSRPSIRPPPHRIANNKAARIHHVAPKRELESHPHQNVNPYCPQNLVEPEFFDAEKFPNATFKSTRVVVGKDGETAEITGDLTVKGVTKPVVLQARFGGAGITRNPPRTGAMQRTIGFSAHTKIKRSDFDMGYGVPLVSDEMSLKISVAFEKPLN